MQFFRSLQTMHANFVCFMGPYTSVFHFLFTLFPVFANIALLIYWRKLGFIVAGILFVFLIIGVSSWMVILQIGKYLWVKGNKSFGSWGKIGFSANSYQNKIIKRFKRSCRLILLRHGNILVLDRIAQFVYVKSLLFLTLKAWLAFK